MRGCQVVAIDPSLTGTAVAYGAFGADEDGPAVARFAVSSMQGTQRLSYLRDSIGGLVKASFVEGLAPLVVIEGYSYGSKGRSHATGELGGVLRLHLAEMLGYDIVEIPPKTVKKFATGNGSASKAKVVSNVSLRLGRVVDTDDEADAIAIYCVGRALLGLDHPMGKLPKTHLSALVNCPPLPGKFT